MARPVHAENLLSTLLFVALAGSACADAQAHGAVASPIARQYQCFKEGGYHWPPDGSQIPGIDCRQAYLAVGGGSEGSWPYQQWHEVAANPKDKGDTLEKVKAAVPDGLLCAGGDARKRGLDQVASPWRATVVTPDADGMIEVVWDLAQSHNPAWLRVFLSSPDYDATRPLTWDDLQEVHHDDAPAPEPGQPYPVYRIKVPVPEGRVGRAVLYNYWQRDDGGNEGFFNCSDIDIQR